MKKFFNIIIFSLIALNIIITASAYMNRANYANTASLPWYSMPVLLLKISVVVFIILFIIYRFLNGKFK